MNMNTKMFDGGKFDGRVAARCGSAPHTNWPKNAEGKYQYSNVEYHCGYVAGYTAVARQSPHNVA